jgi:hypothetical protein
MQHTPVPLLLLAELCKDVEDPTVLSDPEAIPGEFGVRSHFAFVVTAAVGY